MSPASRKVPLQQESSSNSNGVVEYARKRKKSVRGKDLNDDVAEYIRQRENSDPEFAAAFHEERERLALAHRVRALREAHGLSQSQLAEKIGTQQPSIARLESGRGLPRLEVLQRIASALEMRLIVEFVPQTASIWKQYHVSPHPEGWQGKVEGAQRASVVARTKEEALQRTVELAKKHELGQVVIHGENGKIQSGRTYGRDPRKSKG